jgi:serine/threonine protein kinase
VFEIGDRVGEYEIVARLKSGGMATLFLAHRRGAAGFQRFVAIKVVHPHLASDASFVRMFVDEALLSARIVHPNVVHVEELGEAEGTYFLVMEYVHGCSLSLLVRALARRKRMLAAEIATSIVMKVADGLHAAHETRGDRGELLGVVHRDVSPQNVLLAYQGHVKLIDFGIAKAAGRSQQTEAGSIKGKFRYMSPEQAWGRPVDRRSDVFSLGIVLWELLAARPLFDAANDLLVLENVRHPKVDPPSRWLPSIPPSLDEVVLSALAENPDDRPASAQEFRRRLGEALPRALAVDPEALSELMIASMAEQIERDRAALPESVVLKLEGVSGGYTSPGVRPPVRPAAAGEGEDEALKTMTLEALDIQLDELEQAPTRDDSPQPVVRTTSVQRVRDRSNKPWPLMAAVGGVAIAGVGGAFWLASQFMGTSQTATAPTPVAQPAAVTPTPLVPAAPTPPVAPVPAALPAALDAGAVAAPEAGVDVAPAADPGGARAPTKRVTKRRPTGGGPVLVEDDF